MRTTVLQRSPKKYINMFKYTEVVFNQPAGLGDLLFIEPIYRHYHNQGYQVIAPVNVDLLWIQDYIPYVKFVDRKKFDYNSEVVKQKEDGRLHIPLRFSNSLFRGFADLHYGDDRKNWMRDKYLYLGLDENLWRTMQFERNTIKEKALFFYLDMHPAAPMRYNLVNKHFGGSFESVNIKVNNDLPIIYMEKIANYTLLDWLLIIQNAENIYTVETSVIYLIEAFPTQAKEIHLYPRYPFMDNAEYIHSYLQKPNWKFHDSADLK